MIPSAYYFGNPVTGTEWDGVFSDIWVYNITIKYCGAGKPDCDANAWGIYYASCCVNKSLGLSYEPQPSSRTDHWKKTYRHTLSDAQSIAGRFINSIRPEVLGQMRRLHGTPDDARKYQVAMGVREE